MNKDISEAVKKLKKLKVGSDQIEDVAKITVEFRNGERMVFVCPRFHLIQLGGGVAYQIRGKPDFDSSDKIEDDEPAEPAKERTMKEFGSDMLDNARDFVLGKRG